MTGFPASTQNGYVMRNKPQTLPLHPKVVLQDEAASQRHPIQMSSAGPTVFCDDIKEPENDNDERT